MAKKAVLILGGSGYVGAHLALALRDYYKVFATYHANAYAVPGTTFIPFSIDNKLWIKRILHTIQPETIIYLLGSNSIASVERKPRMAERLHSMGPGVMINPSEIVQPKFIYVSNPYVFDGAKGNYHESDTVLPSTVMGKIKVEGENVVKSKFLNYVIIRSSPLFGRGNGIGRSFFDRMRVALSLGQRYEATTHEVHSFGLVSGLAEMIHKIIDLGIRNKVLNYGGITKVSYLEFAMQFAKRFKFDPSLITVRKIGGKSKFTEDFVFDFSLNSTQTANLLKIKPLLLEESFDLIDQQLIPPL